MKQRTEYIVRPTRNQEGVQWRTLRDAMAYARAMLKDGRGVTVEIVTVPAPRNAGGNRGNPDTQRWPVNHSTGG